MVDIICPVIGGLKESVIVDLLMHYSFENCSCNWDNNYGNEAIIVHVSAFTMFERSSGKMPVFEQLKITQKDSDIKLGQIQKCIAEILSKPVALDLQSFYRWENTMFRVVQCSVITISERGK